MARVFFTTLLFVCSLHITGKCQIDTNVGLMKPVKFGTDYLAIASYLCFDLETEQLKANAIYNWVTHNIAYDIEALHKIPNRKEDKVIQALKTKKAVCEGYSLLFTELCRAAGLKAVTIEGYAKDWIFDDGDELYIPRHQWSAVRIDNKWQLVDPTWGAGVLAQSPGWLRRMRNKITHKNNMYAKHVKFKFKYDTTYFMQDPEEFRLKHLPSDPWWQLTDSVMPLAVFEAGDSAIKVFNKLHSKPQQVDSRLDRIAEMTEKEKIYDFADRAYAYNNRYHVILALKNTYHAEALINKAIKDTTIKRGDTVLNNAVKDLKVSLEYIKQQRRNFPNEYNKLKMKNKEKSFEAKKYIRKVKTDDKKLMAECNKRMRIVDSKDSRWGKKLDEIKQLKKTVNPDNIDGIETAKVTKKAGSPQLVAIKDSVVARENRAKDLLKEAYRQSHNVRLDIIKSTILLNSLAGALNKEDSMLKGEVEERLDMHDSHDEEVMKWSGMFEKQKYEVTDSMMNDYFGAFDSIVARCERAQTIQLAALDLYKKNEQGLEQYRKWNNTDASIKNDYIQTANDYSTAIDSTGRDCSILLAHLQGNKQLFSMLTKLCKRQIAIVDYMENVEQKRQELEHKNIAKNKAFDIKENDWQREGVQKALKQLQNAVKQLEH